jgi:hypothetical protein
MRARRRLLLLLSPLVLCAGCKTYEITQFDHYAAAELRPAEYRSVAIITHHEPGSIERNKLFLEGAQVVLMKRGLDVIEREQFDKLVSEQLLIKGDMADLSDRDKAIRVGKMQNVDVVFYADALMNNTRYEYQPPPFASQAEATRLQKRANENGVVEGVGRFDIHAYHNVGVTMRAIDARSGEIVWVGYRMLAVCEKVTKHSPTALTNFDTVQRLCNMVFDDFFQTRPAAARS